MKKSELEKIILEEIEKVLFERGGGVRPLPRQIRRILKTRNSRNAQSRDQLPMRGYWNPQTKRVEPQISLPARAGEVLPFRRPVDTKKKTEKELQPQKIKQDIGTKTKVEDPLADDTPCVADFKKLWMLYKESLGREDFITDVNTWSQNNRATPCEIDLFFAGLCVYGSKNTAHNYQIGRFSLPIMVEYRVETGSVDAFGFGDCGAFGDNMYYEASDLIYWENKKQQAILKKIEEIKRECEVVVGEEALEQWEEWFADKPIEHVSQCLILSEMSKEKVTKIISFAVDMPTAREVVKECPQFIEWLENRAGVYNCAEQMASIEDLAGRKEAERKIDSLNDHMEQMLEMVYGEHPTGGSWVEEMDAGRLERPDGSWIVPGDKDWIF